MTALTDKAAYRKEPRLPDSPADELSGEDVDIVLEPLSHPELGEIRIEDSLFAVGRNEPPFTAYEPEIVADLSRRHARLFSEAGGAYLADLGSKNGTTVNGVDMRQKTVRLRHGDEIGFGSALRYRVRLAHRNETQAQSARLLSLTLTPEHGELGLQPIIISRFPFLVSKSDMAFSQYKEAFPEQLNYLSRRHAHLFLKAGLPWVEDLGSTNGTFLSGRRLDEHAAPLSDGDTLAFGGHHFVYRVSLQLETAPEPTVTRLGVQAPAAKSVQAAQVAQVAQAPAEEAAGHDLSDKTTFVASADSFLDIFCIDQSRRAPAEEANDPDKARTEARAEPARRARQGPVAGAASELLRAFWGSGAAGTRRFPWGVLALGILVAGVAAYLLLRPAPDQQIREQLASGRHEEAARLAGAELQRHPGSAEFKALGTEALMKARVPPWLARLKANDFAGAEKEIAAMKTLAVRNDDALALIAQLDWLGKLERYMHERGGMEAPLRMYADEEGIAALLRQWNEDAQRRQRDYARIAAMVPQFADPYALALSHLRKLQSDDAVYLSAIARLKAAIDAELDKEQADTVEAMLNDYAEKYPRLKGLDAVRQDLQRYLALESAARARDLPKVAALTASDGFATPQFQARVAALRKKNALPAEEVVRQYAAVSREWRQGHAEQAMGVLRGMAAGPWDDALRKEARRKEAVQAAYAALQKPGAGSADERLITFYGSLDPDEDVWFVRAVESDLGKVRDKALKRAQELQGRAQSEWRRYRDSGSIASEQRLEPAVSAGYRNQARALAQSGEHARQAMQLYTQLKAEAPEPLARLREDIERETDSQRRSLLELDRQLEPGILQAKLALLGRDSDEGRSPAKAAN